MHSSYRRYFVGKALLVDARIELEINQQTWHLHKLLYTPERFTPKREKADP